MRYILALLMITSYARGLTVRVDYRYDSGGFFDNPEARAVIEAVAARWSRIIDERLAPVNSFDDDTDRRFLLRNPSTGITMEVSSAASKSTDELSKAGAPVADEYWNGIVVPADEWIVFVGARNLDSLAAGGPLGGGFNFESVFDEEDGLLNRGFNVGYGSLNVLGGNISFDSETNWHFNHLTAPPPGTVDFYSIALHEMGHCFGLASSGGQEWSSLISGVNYVGVHALAAFQEDSGASVVTLPIAGVSVVNGVVKFDSHWRDGQIKSKIFQPGLPNYRSTVGQEAHQEVLMASTANFTANYPRLELTNVDVAALKDIGWSVISSDPEAMPVSIGRNAQGDLMLEFECQAGAVYTIQTSSTAGGWQNVTPSITGDGNSIIWTTGSPGFHDPNGLGVYSQSGFFRVLKN